MPFRCLFTLCLFATVIVTNAAAQAAVNNLVYEIFVRSFADSVDADRIGDLRGIIDKLDPYLNDGNPSSDTDLEVGLLWLMPIFPATSYHGYDVVDYRNVTIDYGTLSDFTALIAAAHSRGVRIILDIPFNHTSNQHPWFVEAVQNAASPKRAYYLIKADDGSSMDNWHATVSPSGERLQYFGLFGSTMPDLNYDNTTVRSEVKQIARYWLGLGADGFRLDAAKHIYGDFTPTEQQILKNNDWWREFSDDVYRANAQAVLFGEVLGDREIERRHAWGLDGLVDEEFMNEARDQSAWPKPGFIGRWKSFVDAARAVNQSAYIPGSPYADIPFNSFAYVSSHDQNPRLASAMEAAQRNGMAAPLDAAYRLNLSMLLSMSNFAIIYYGDEIMQPGWKWNGNQPWGTPPGDGSGVYDETLREPFDWYKAGDGPGQAHWLEPFLPKFDRPSDGVSVEEENTQPGTVDWLRGLTNLRTRHSVFAGGDILGILSDTSDWMVFEKGSNADRYLVLINPSPQSNNYEFHPGWYQQYSGSQLIYWSDGGAKSWADETANSKHIGQNVFVPAFGMVILRQGH